MCNAWNHPPNCTCGFGGGNAGQHRVFSEKISYSLGRFDKATYDIYVNENAKCPECGQSVFFYQSSSGGRVFFDELGPPWPKHSCTDKAVILKVLNEKLPDSYQHNISSKYSWQKDGWDPFFVIREINIDKNIRKISGKHLGKNFTDNFFVIYINNNSLHKIKDSISYIKETKHGCHQISFLSRSGEGVCMNAYTLHRDAVRNPSPLRRLPGARSYQRITR